MSRNKVSCFALTALLSLVGARYALAADAFSYSSVASADAATGAFSAQLGGELSNDSIDRLLSVNGSQQSVLRKDSVIQDLDQDQAEKKSSAPVELAPMMETPAVGKGMMILAGCGAALALGLGLCCASLLASRPRGVTTFTAHLVKIK